MKPVYQEDHINRNSLFIVCFLFFMMGLLIGGAIIGFIHCEQGEAIPIEKAGDKD